MASPSLPPIIDSHQHFWLAAGGHHKSDYLPADYLADAVEARIDLRASVFVECGTQYDVSLPPALQSTGETRFAAAQNQAAGSANLAAAIVAHADPTDTSLPFADVIAAHRDASCGLLRGIRRMTAWSDDPAFNFPALRTRREMMATPQFATALHILAGEGLLFEAWLYHSQLDELARLARAAPDCMIVLDHAGTPLARGEDHGAVFAEWRDGMASLADCPNVHVKLGGLVTFLTPLDAVRRSRGLARWTDTALAEALEPYLDHIRASFGPARCLFESNFPVDSAHCDLGVLARAYAMALHRLSAPDLAAVFASNAAELYF